jgi:hypothetical protein
VQYDLYNEYKRGLVQSMFIWTFAAIIHFL